jgi:hypothetical protein
MATDKIVNINELSPQGYWKPANTVNAVSPDNVTHAQLRYSDFSASYVVQGSIVSGENSTFKFSIADNLATELFKLYTSTDGTTYTVDKRFGGDNGVKLFGTNDLSGLVTLTTAQNISGTKTLTGNANIVVGSGSDITVQTGGDITLADAPTASTDATNKAYVDGLIGYKSCVFWVSSFTPNESTALNYTRIYNNTGVTPTLTYGQSLFGAQGLRVTFNRTSSNSDIILPGKLFTDDGFGSKNDAGFLGVSETFAQSSANTVMDLYYVDDVWRSWTVSQANIGGVDIWSRFTLSGGTLTRTVGNSGTAFTDQDFVAATLKRTEALLASNAVVATSEERKNFRIELRFYD